MTRVLPGWDDTVSGNSSADWELTQKAGHIGGPLLLFTRLAHASRERRAAREVKLLALVGQRAAEDVFLRVALLFIFIGFARAAV